MKASCLPAALLCAVLLGAGCTTEPLPLAGTRWELTRLHGQPVNSPLGLTLQFESRSNRIFGFTGVNRFGGVYAIAEPTLITLPVLTTRVEGPEAETTLETEFLAVLNEFGTYRIQGDMLDLFVGGERAARFFATAP